MKRALLFVCLAACSTPPPRRLVVRTARLVDGTGGPVQSGMRVIVEDGAILAVEPDVEPMPEGAVLDWRHGTTMPGLIDTHVHVTGPGACRAVGYGVAPIARNLASLLAAGVTTAADLAAPVDVAVGMRRWVGTARHRGPRLLVAGPLVSNTGGYLSDVADGKPFDVHAAEAADTPEQGRALVQKLADAGVDLIKVGTQEESFSKRPLELMKPEVMCAIVEEAHRQELRVVAHVTTNRGYTLALDCKVDALVHSDLEPLPEPLLRRVVDNRVPVAPTLFVFEAPLWGVLHPDNLERPVARRVLSDEVRQDLVQYIAEARAMPEALPDTLYATGVQRADVERLSAAARANTGRLRSAGALLALGTDGGVCFDLDGDPVQELLRLAAAGIPAPEALRLATSGSARLLGLDDALGRIGVGYRADLIEVDGQPDQDLAALERVQAVVLDGIEQRLGTPGWTDTVTLGLRLLWTKLGL